MSSFNNILSRSLLEKLCLALLFLMMTTLVAAEEYQLNTKEDRATIGINIQEVTEELARAFKLPSTKGAIVADAKKDGAAYLAGVRAGDVILKLNEETVNHVLDIPEIMGKVKIHQSTPVVIWRYGTILNFIIFPVAYRPTRNFLDPH